MTTTTGLGEVLRQIDEACGEPGKEDEYDPEVVKDLIWQNWSTIRQGLRDRAWDRDLLIQDMRRLFEDDPINGYGGWRLKLELLERSSNAAGDYERWPGVKLALNGQVVVKQVRLQDTL